ncbi:replication factor C large subunit [archaeon]|nr:replication factor C large subunit [archaeon]
MIWTKKYAPVNSKELVGEIRSIMKLEDFVNNFKSQRKKAMILYGPTGTGKTEAVYALAKEKNLEIIELNASDVRKKDHILEIVGNAIKQGSLFGSGKIILIDEIDGLSGMKDRGGAQALASLIGGSAFPIIMTANDPWQSKLSSLRRKTLMVEVPALSSPEICKVLRRICERETIVISEYVLKSVANRAGGDLRSAINDLQLICCGRKEITKEHLEEIGERNKEEDVFNLLRVIFKSTDSKLILDTFDKTNLKFEEVALWVDENLPKEYFGHELGDAYDKLSKSDVFKGRIMRRQHWRFMVYQKYFMSVGVAISKKGSKKGFVNYERSKRILKMWIAKMKYGKRKSICEKISSKCHVSSKRAMKDIFPYVKNILSSESEFLDLSEEEVGWLEK